MVSLHPMSVNFERCVLVSIQLTETDLTSKQNTLLCVRLRPKLHSSVLIFHEKVKTSKVSPNTHFIEKAHARHLLGVGVCCGQVYLRDCTPVSPYPVLLFGGRLSVYHRQVAEHTPRS